MPSCRVPQPARSAEVSFPDSVSPPLPAAKNLKLNITFYHQQHKPDKPPPRPRPLCQSPRCHHYSLWPWHRVSTQLRACCTVHDVPSFHPPIISTVWGKRESREGGWRRMQSSCWTSAEFWSALSRCVRLLGSPRQWLPVITAEIAANAENWQGYGVYTQTQSGSFVAACDAYTVFLTLEPSVRLSV